MKRRGGRTQRERLAIAGNGLRVVADPGLRRAIADYLKRERTYVEAAGEELAAAAPFRKDLIEQD